MTPTTDFLYTAEKHLQETLRVLRPQLLAVHGRTASEFKADRSVVTAADIMVEERLKEVCTSLDPALGFYGEETGIDKTGDAFWLVDPIDGTESFVRGLPFSTNMIALIDHHRPVLSIIYNFVTDNYYLAIEGHGATRNGQTIRVSRRPLRQSFVAVSVGAEALEKIAAGLRPQVTGLPMLQSSGADATMVAQGSFDALIAMGRKGIWDHAAPTLLMREAGARVENFRKTTYDYRDMHYVAANPLIFDDLKRFADSRL